MLTSRSLVCPSLRIFDNSEDLERNTRSLLVCLRNTYQKSNSGSSTALGVPCSHFLDSGSSSSRGRRVSSSFFFVNSRYLDDTCRLLEGSNHAWMAVPHTCIVYGVIASASMCPFCEVSAMVMDAPDDHISQASNVVQHEKYPSSIQCVRQGVACKSRLPQRLSFRKCPMT